MPSHLSFSSLSAPSQVPRPDLTLLLTARRPLTAVQVEKLFDAAQMQYGPERYSARVHQQDRYRFVLTLVPIPRWVRSRSAWPPSSGPYSSSKSSRAS
jgi:hypothetical protein